MTLLCNRHHARAYVYAYTMRRLEQGQERSRSATHFEDGAVLQGVRNWHIGLVGTVEITVGRNPIIAFRRKTVEKGSDGKLTGRCWLCCWKCGFHETQCRPLPLKPDHLSAYRIPHVARRQVKCTRYLKLSSDASLIDANV